MSNHIYSEALYFASGNCDVELFNLVKDYKNLDWTNAFGVAASRDNLTMVAKYVKFTDNTIIRGSYYFARRTGYSKRVVEWLKENYPQLCQN
jgi:hypothetical protein